MHSSSPTYCAAPQNNITTTMKIGCKSFLVAFFKTNLLINTSQNKKTKQVSCGKHGCKYLIFHKSLRLRFFEKFNYFKQFSSVEFNILILYNDTVDVFFVVVDNVFITSACMVFIVFFQHFELLRNRRFEFFCQLCLISSVFPY